MASADCLTEVFQHDLGRISPSAHRPEPPAALTLALAGLWWDAKGDWTRAHESAQQDEGPEGSWVHAYLHRKKRRSGQRRLPVQKAGKPVCREPLGAEWFSIVGDLLCRLNGRGSWLGLRDRITFDVFPDDQCP